MLQHQNVKIINGNQVDIQSWYISWKSELHVTDSFEYS